MPNKNRSPRYPSVDIGEALNRVEKVYLKENKHFIDPNAAAKSLGYKNANSGPSKSMIATLIYYGLFERDNSGKIAVSKDYEQFRFAPNAEIKADFLKTWFLKPDIFHDLTEKYGDQLPSDDALKYELLQMRFSAKAADSLLKIYKSSINYLKDNNVNLIQENDNTAFSIEKEGEDANATTHHVPTQQHDNNAKTISPLSTESLPLNKITVILPNNREAILFIPNPISKKDKKILSKQIDALYAEDEEDDI